MVITHSSQFSAYLRVIRTSPQRRAPSCRSPRSGKASGWQLRHSDLQAQSLHQRHGNPRQKREHRVNKYRHQANRHHADHSLTLSAAAASGFAVPPGYHWFAATRRTSRRRCCREEKICSEGRHKLDLKKIMANSVTLISPKAVSDLLQARQPDAQQASDGADRFNPTGHIPGADRYMH